MSSTRARHRVPRTDRTSPGPEFWAARDLVDSSGGQARHARADASGFALPIGRVGALAVSLGIGLAVANSAGVAYADSDSDTPVASGSNDAESTSTEPRADTSTGDESESESDSDTGEVEADPDDEAEDGDEGASGDTDPDVPPSDEDDPVEADLGADDGSEQPPLSETPTEESSPPADPDDAPVGWSPAGDSGEAPPVEESVAEQDESSLGPVDEAMPVSDSLIASDEATTGAPTSQASVTPDASEPPAEEAAESVDVFTALITGIASPLVDPATPARAPWFDALLAWVRRQISHTFFNESPEWGPVTSQQAVTGQVIIDLAARDPNGDPLTYTIIAPEHGTVFRDPLTGKFVYTPNSVVTGSPLVDSFKVVISDSSEHLRGLAGVVQGVLHFLARAIGIAERDDVTLLIPVVANPIVEAPPVVVVSPAAGGTTGTAITVSPIVVITDLDSEKLASATVKINDPASGDVLGWGTLPTGVTATTGNGSVTFTGAASVAAYQQLLQSVTLTSTAIGVKTISFSVIDDQGNVNAVPAGTVVTVLGLPVEMPPLVVVSPVAAGTVGSPVTLSPIVVITDLDSDELDSATVTVNNPGAGDVLGYGAMPEGVHAVYSDGVLTFTGRASIDDYRQLLASVTLTSSGAGLKSVSFAVVDSEGNASVVPAATAVTVVGLPVQTPPLVVVSPVAGGITGSPITVSPIVVVTDLDSDELDAATVVLTDPVAGDVLGYGSLPTGVEASYADGVLTFTGRASVDDYRQLLASVTLTSTGAGLKAVSFAVTDADGNTSAVPAGTVVTVLGIPGISITPVLVVSPVAAGSVGSPITVSPIVVITDLDSDELDSATVVLGNPVEGDTLGYGELPDGVEASYADGVLTFTGTASVAVYQQLLQSVTLTSSTPGLKAVSFGVVDGSGNGSAVAAATVVTVLGAPGVSIAPVIVTTPVAAGSTGSAVVVSPIVVITDLDSDQLSSATVTVKDPSPDDVLGWGSIPAGVDVSYVDGVLSFTGAASVDEYRQLLQSVTLTSAGAGLKSVTFAVTDAQGNTSAVPAGTVVTVLGVPGVSIPPVLAVLPAAAGTAGSPIKVSPIVVITDLDSNQIDRATVTLSESSSGDAFGYGPLPTGVDVTFADGVLTFSGRASAEVYRQLLQSVTLSSTSAGMKVVSFSVTDADGNISAVPASTVVTVLGLPAVSLPPVVVVAPVAAGTVGSPIRVSPVVVITDLDSEEIGSAAVTINDPAAGDVLAWGSVPEGISAAYAGGVLTFSGSASVAVYQQLLQSVTLTSTGAGLKSVSFVVVDADGNASAVPAATVVTVVGLASEVAPLVVVSPVAAGSAGSPMTVSPVVVITDLDSDQIGSATVTVNNPSAGDVLSWGGLPTGVDVHYADGVLTFTGSASVEIYQQLLQSVKLTSTGAGLKSVSFAVTDAQGNTSTVPAGTVVTIVGLATEVPPLVVVSPVAAGAVGAPITVSPVVVITDLDSDQIGSATVTVNNASADDVLGWGSVPEGISAAYSGGVLTFTGAASVAVYQQLLQSVTLTSTGAGLKSVSFVVVDADGNASAVPAATVVTVVGLASEVAPLVVVSPVAAGSAGSPITVSPIVVITDLDSEEIGSATVTINDPAAGDVLGWGAVPEGISAEYSGGVLTFTGTASVAVYQQLLASVTLTSTGAGLKSVSFTVVDGEGNASSVPAGTVVTIVGLATEVPPLVVVSPVAAGSAGSPIAVSPIVVITDLDSDELDSATVVLGNPVEGDTLGYGELPGGVEASYADGVLTFTGTASVAVYQQLLQSVTLTSSTPGLKSVSFAVVDGGGNASSVPAGTVVTVVGLASEVPPLVVVSPVAAGSAGSPITVSPIVVITDLDSDEIDSATVTLNDPAAGDELGWGAVPDGISAAYSGGVLTFTGTASVAAYQQLLQSVTLTSTGAGLRSVSFAVTDAQGNTSAVPAGTVVTVVGLASEVPPLVVVSPVAAGSAGSPITVSPIVVITDLDSEQIGSATVTVNNASAGDVLGWGPSAGGHLRGILRRRPHIYRRRVGGGVSAVVAVGDVDLDGCGPEVGVFHGG